MNRKITTRKMVVTAILGAITVVLGLTPLGFIPLGLISITTMHIPVIVAGILEGPFVGGLVGLIFGLSSMLNAVLRPTPISFIFLNPIVSVLPRILIGVFSAYVYKFLKKKNNDVVRKLTMAIWIIVALFLSSLLYKNITAKADIFQVIIIAIFLVVSILMFILSIKNKNINFDVAIASFVGTMTNSVLVITLIYLMYAESYVKALSIPVTAARATIFGAIATNGIPEAIFSIVIISAITKAVKRK